MTPGPRSSATGARARDALRLAWGLLLPLAAAATPARAADGDNAAQAPAEALAPPGRDLWGRVTTAPVGPGLEAQDRTSADGVYGRFASRLDLGVAVGTELGEGTPWLAARLSAHWYSMAGLYLAYADAAEDREPRRRLSVGADLRPLFLPRWTLDLEQGPAFLDLALDSCSLSVGAFFEDSSAQAFGRRRGLELGLGGGLPLFAEATGLWLEGRATARWLASGEDASGEAGAEWTGLVLLALHDLVSL